MGNNKIGATSRQYQMAQEDRIASWVNKKYIFALAGKHHEEVNNRRPCESFIMLLIQKDDDSFIHKLKQSNRQSNL